MLNRPSFIADILVNPPEDIAEEVRAELEKIPSTFTQVLANQATAM